MFAGEPAHAAAQRQSAHTCVRDVARGGGQVVRLGGRIECTEEGSALDPCPPTLRVDTDRAHRGQVDHQATLGHRQPDDTVATAADADLQTLLPSQRHGAHDVLGVAAADDQRRPTIHHGVPHRARLLVRRVPGRRISGSVMDSLLLLGAVSERWHDQNSSLTHLTRASRPGSHLPPSPFRSRGASPIR